MRQSAEVVGACESAYGCAYYNTISWRNETTPLPMENRPRAIFDRLFGDAGSTGAKARLVYRSVLDAVAQDVGRLRGKLAAADRGKIDQYLEAVRDVERRIQLAQAQGDHDRPQLAGPGADGMTALIWAAYLNDVQMADLLLRAGALCGRGERGFGNGREAAGGGRRCRCRCRCAPIVRRNAAHGGGPPRQPSHVAMPPYAPWGFSRRTTRSNPLWNLMRNSARYSN
jgi:hypothetical protein